MTDDLDLSAVASDAALLDALAAGDLAAGNDALAGLASLRAALDDDLGDLLTAVPVAPLQAAPVGEVVGLRLPTGRRVSARTRRRAAAVIAGAALTLSSTGVAAATYEARPGNAFYGLRTAVAGPRAEDPDVLRDRLDAVQQQLQSPDAAVRDAARDELDEVASLLSELPPGLRRGLDRKHAALTQQLEAAERPAGSAGETPAGPKTPVGPPAGTPGAGRTPDARPTATRGPQSSKPSAKPAPPPAEPQPNGPKATPKDRPTQEPTEQPGRPSPRRSQGVDRPDDPQPTEDAGNTRSEQARGENARPEDPRDPRPTEPTPVPEDEPVDATD